MMPAVPSYVRKLVKMVNAANTAQATANWAALLTMILLPGLAGPAIAGFVPSADAVLPDHVLSPLHDDLSAARWGDAIDRIEASLANPAALAKIDDRLVSLPPWVNEQLTEPGIAPGSAAAFATAYNARIGVSAAAALATAVRDGDVTAMAGVIARYPWTDAAAHAPLEMANRLCAVGDLVGVQSLLPALPAAPPPLKTLADLPSASDGRRLPFAGPWFNLIRPIDFPRDVPWASKDAVFIASTSAVAALSLQGRLLWSTGHVAAPIELPKLWPSFPVSMSKMLFGERSLSQPALWCDSMGVAKILIARQSENARSSLCAWHAADGTPLWNTADAEASKTLLFLGTPLIRGRYVYSLALDYRPPSVPKMCMVALDLPNGRVLWRTSLGDATLPMVGLPDNRSINGSSAIVAALVAASAAELSADDRSVYAALEGGYILSLDRFGGQIHWFAPYPARATEYHELFRMREKNNRAVQHRWHDRVTLIDDLAVVAAADSAAVVAVDAATGKLRWTFDGADRADLVGAVSGRLIFAGERLMALKPDGTLAWQVDYTNSPAGPALIDGQTIVIPTQSGVTVYAPDSGKASPMLAATLFDSVIKPPPTRKALYALGLLETFAMPPGESPAVPEKPAAPAKTPGWKTKPIPKKPK